MAWISAIDVSKYQDLIDWPNVTQPIVLVKISGGDGGLYYDPMANRNYYGAKGAGKSVGGYHFAGGGDPVAEADYFLKGMQPYEENDVFALDFELEGFANPGPWCAAFVNHVHDVVGVWPLVYAPRGLMQQIYPHVPNCGLWVADPNDSPDSDVHFNGTVVPYTYVMHQYGQQFVAGIIANVTDLNAWFGTVEEFNKYGWHKINQEDSKQPTSNPAQNQVTTPQVPSTATTPPIIQDVTPSTQVSPPVSPEPTPGTVVQPNKPVQVIVNDPVAPQPVTPTPDQVDSQITTDINEAQTVLNQVSKFRIGLKTSEFWTTAVTSVATFIEGVVRNHTMAVRITALLTIGAIIVVYIWSRTHVKKNLVV